MNKNKLKKLIAVCVALAGTGVFAFSGCANHGSGHTHTWTTKYYAEGADGHYRRTTCLDHATEMSALEEHDGDTCSKCGYVKNSGANVAVESITLDRSSLTMAVGGEDVTLTATVSPENANDKTYTWSSSNTAAATVSGGVVHAVAEGNATITVTTTDGGHTATCQVTVKAAGATIGKDPSKPSDPFVKPDDPVISNPAQGVKITKASAGELETAYVEWTAADGAEWYNVYVSPKGENQWKKLDAPLVRQYKNYYRADALGLAAGTYDMKVVPSDSNGTEMAQQSATAEKLTVCAHERMGYAFIDDNVPGAYNMDGTLKTDAQVVYVTAANAKTVTATVGTTDKKGNVTEATVTGFQAIIDARAKSAVVQSPLCFRIVGTIDANDMDSLSSSSEGLQIKGASATSPIENITIEGVGNDGTFFGFGMLLRNSRNDEIRNLGILNCMDDGISIDTDNSHLWVHNNDIFYGKGGSGDKAKGDGALDTKGSTLITHSYNHFWDCGKCNLQGMTSEKPDNRITYHHNWYDHSDSRHPRIRTATVHIFNNYFDGNAKYGVGVTLGANAFVENNYFRSTSKMKPMMSSLQGTDIAHGKDGQTFSGEAGGMIKAYGNHFEGTYELLTQNDTDPDNIDCYLASTRDEKVPATYKTKSGGTTYSNFDTADSMYEYTVDTPEQAKIKVTRYAGRVDGGDLKWTFDNAKEDPNYSVIPELKAAILAYKTAIVKIGKED